jgi:hypothetical protein
VRSKPARSCASPFIDVSGVFTRAPRGCASRWPYRFRLAASSARLRACAAESPGWSDVSSSSVARAMRASARRRDELPRP